MGYLQLLHSKINNLLFFKLFTWDTLILLSFAFIPSGLKKVHYQQFTALDLSNPIGFFSEALYRTGFIGFFLGFIQLLTALLILITRTTTFAAILYVPIVANIFIIVQSMGFKGTNYVAGLMLLANIYLLFWDYDKTKLIMKTIFKR